MSVAPEDIDRLAELARLRLSGSEREQLRADLERVLEHVRQLEGLNVAEVPPTKHVIDLVDVTRADEPAASLPAEEIEAMAPELEEGHFVVPPVLPD